MLVLHRVASGGPVVTRLDPGSVADLRRCVESLIDERGLRSCQYALGLDGEVVVAETLGDAPSGARYVLFSATKIVPVVAAWQLLGEGALHLEAPVTRWWPEFGRHGKDRITVEQVLAHTAGVPLQAVDPVGIADRDRRVAQMEDWTLDWEPGSRFEYHAFSAHWILAELIARASDMDHRDAIRTRLLDPLGLPRLELGVPIERQGDVQPLAPAGAPSTLAELTDELGPELAAVLAPMVSLVPDPADDPTISAVVSPEGLAAGIPGAGAVSDAPSLVLLYQALLHDERGLWDRRLLADLRERIVTTDPGIFGQPAMRGLGTEIAGEGPVGDRRRRIGSGFTSPRTFGHSGAGGQIAWADLETGLSFAFVTNGWDRNLVQGLRRDRMINEYAARCAVRDR